ncbi:MAG: guanylate kinase [Sedimentisphaerales bacterium]|nr:guanylate kinase [Sedimentisphaerales bacterium]
MKKAKVNKGQIVIVSGPSGAGKSTICQRVVEMLDEACLSVSVTTRPKSKTEKDGIDYWFISKKEFQDRIDKGLLLEYANVFGNMYGTPKDKVDEILKAGKIIILEIDVQGARQVKAVYPDAIMIFILPPSEKVLAERIANRGRDSSDSVELRLDGANAEIAAARQYYEHMVVNEDLQQAVNTCVQIIRQARA